MNERADADKPTSTIVADWTFGAFRGLVVLRESVILRFHCGYLRLPEGHPWIGKGTIDVPASVHGGITWSNNFLGFDDVDNGSWWIGFDCAHWNDSYIRDDLDPRLQELLPGLRRVQMGIFRDVDYVKGELVKLAAQASLAMTGTG